MAVILIIDDQKPDRDILARLVEAQGHVAIVAASAAEAISLLCYQPQIALVDLVMPETDGLQAMSAIKSAAPAILVVAVTGATYRGFNPLEVAIELGADGALKKPVTADTLSAEISRLLEDGSEVGSPAAV